MTATEKIAALRSKHEAATPEPWAWDARGDLRPVPHDEYGLDCIIGYDPILEVPVLEPGDAAAIAALHNAAPGLLKALEDVLEMHYDEEDGLGTDLYCHCGQWWPCPTYTAIEDALAEVTS